MNINKLYKVSRFIFGVLLSIIIFVTVYASVTNDLNMLWIGLVAGLISYPVAFVFYLCAIESHM